MRKMRLRVILLCAICAAAAAFVLPLSLFAEQTKADRGKLKIGYAQAGDYYEFDYQIYQIGMALVKDHEIVSDRLARLSQGDSARDVWDALCAGKSDTYEFGEDGYFDLAAGEYAALSEEELQEALAEQIAEQGIDVMITMGTSAGLTVKEACDVPYMNFIASDPVGSHIVEGAETSGDPRAWAHVNDGVDKKALSVMDDIFSPKKIGIVYNGDDPEAYIYSGAASLDDYADRYRKKVVSESVSDEFEDTEEAYQTYFSEMCAAHQKLADAGIDAYVLTTSYLRLEDFDEALEPFMEAGIPVFSINSTEDVRCGALAAVEMLDYQNIGRFAADTLKQYREGASFADLPQQYATAPFLVVNADTMRRTGVKLPLDTLISASEIYGKYESENE